MGEQTNGFDQNGRGTADAPEVDIPLLKKKEKERKGGGLALPGALLGGGEIAAGAGVGKAGGLLALLGGKLGLAAVALGLGGAGVIAFGVSQQRGTAASEAPQLGALASNIAVGRRNATGSKSLSYMAEAGSGQLKWEDPNKPKPEPAADKPSDAPADAAAMAAEDAAGEEGMSEPSDSKPRMANNLSGAKLAGALGGSGTSGAFGKNNIFSKGTGFNIKSTDLKAKSGLGGPKLSAQSGRLSGARRGKNNLTAKSISTNKITGKSIGQLKFAGTRSQAARNAGDGTAASTYAADAFDQQKSNGGSLEAGAGAGAAGAGLGTVSPVGSGAPDSTSAACASGDCAAPDLGPGVSQTNYQGLLDNVLKMQEQAQQMMMTGMALIVAGGILMVAGWPGWGAIIGAIMIALGLAFLAMAKMMNNQADAMADMIGGGYQQQDQAEILKGRGDASSQAGVDEANDKLGKDNVDSGMGEETYTESSN